MKKAVNKLRWEQIADIWDKGIGEKGDIRHELVINPIVGEFLGDLHGKTVLDAGCGNGYISRKMAKTAKKVVGVDFTEKLVEIAITRSQNFHNIEYKVENLEALQLSDALFDVVLCNMVLMDLANLDRAVAEIARVTKPGGLIVISTQHPCFENAHKAYPLHDKKGVEVGRVITDYFTPGLVIDKYEGFPHYHWLLSQYLNSFAVNHLFLEETREPNNRALLKEKMTEVVRNHTPMFISFKLRKMKD
ncbi:MAG TPA: class I SAM-dependent methyltransferase [Patescibacteria group bacterium]|nr:class I SAM-dependent methyltransferase [Patescibacteria group bacterium]